MIKSKTLASDRVLFLVKFIITLEVLLLAVPIFNDTFIFICIIPTKYWYN